MEDSRKIYIWEASIPDKWKEIAGEDYFVHISKSGKAKNTLEFMSETQRYIHKIRSTIESGNKPISFPHHIFTKKRKLKEKLFEKRSEENSPSEQRKSLINYKSESIIGRELIKPKVQTQRDSPKLPKIKRAIDNHSDEMLGEIKKDYLLFTNQHIPYTKPHREKNPEYICLPKALQANSNRIYNSFSNPYLTPNSLESQIPLKSKVGSQFSPRIKDSYMKYPRASNSMPIL